MKIQITTRPIEVRFQITITPLLECARPRAQQFPPARQPANYERPSPRRASLWPRTATLLLALAIALGSETTTAALYQPGDTVTNLTFVARREFTSPDGTVIPAGAQVGIHDLAGRILFLEWFAVWCPFCTAAEPQIDAGIVEWYAARGGNPYGVPVLYMFVNQESGGSFQTATTSYINNNLSASTICLNDYGIPGSNPVRTGFQTSGQPIFAVINGVTNSPTHTPWKLLVNHLGFGDTEFSQEILNFRAAIDAVQPAVIAPVITNPKRVGANFEFNFQTQPGRIYRVLGSTNLTIWTALSTNASSTNLTLFRHTNAPTARNYYRVVTP